MIWRERILARGVPCQSNVSNIDRWNNVRAARLIGQQERQVQEESRLHVNFRERLSSGKVLLGTIVSLSSPAVIDTLSRVGFDWLWLDMEHSPLSLEQIQTLLTAKTPYCAGLVRVPTNEDQWIKRVLDLGADGIIVPHVSSRADAEYAVRCAKYPPTGSRSFGAGRAHAYGIDAAYQAMANDTVAVVVQIEDQEAVANIDEIISVKGIDAIIIGPYDLSGSFGKLGQLGDQEVQHAIDRVRRACAQKNFPAGIFALLPEQGRQYIDAGFRLVAVGADVHTLWSSAKQMLDGLKREPVEAILGD